MVVLCSRCGTQIQVPDELIGDVDPDEYRSGVLTLVENYFCDGCEPDNDEQEMSDEQDLLDYEL